MIEKELKLTTDEAGYKVLEDTFKSRGKSKHQVNHYFDTDDFKLGKSGITLRVRREGDEYLVTCKLKKSKIQGIVMSEEYEYPCTKEVAKSVVSGETHILTLFPDECVQKVLSICESADALTRKGCIDNVRYSAPMMGGVKFELDRSTFPDGSVTYELEIEGITTTSQSEAVINCLKTSKVSVEESAGSKYERFIKSLGGTK